MKRLFLFMIIGGLIYSADAFGGFFTQWWKNVYRGRKITGFFLALPLIADAYSHVKQEFKEGVVASIQKIENSSFGKKMEESGIPYYSKIFSTHYWNYYPKLLKSEYRHIKNVWDKKTYKYLNQDQKNKRPFIDRFKLISIGLNNKSA